EWIRKQERWRAGKLRDLEATVDRLKRSGTSPIAAAMKRASEEGFPRRYDGSKVLLVLTDGEDNQTLGPSAKPERIRRCLKDAFFGKRIDVNVVCFNSAKDKGVQLAKEQFGVVEDFNPPGEFVIEPNAGALAASMERALRPVLHIAAPGFPESGVPVNRPHENLRPVFFEPSTYVARMQKVQKIYT